MGWRCLLWRCLVFACVRAGHGVKKKPPGVSVSGAGGPGEWMRLVEYLNFYVTLDYIFSVPLPPPLSRFVCWE